MESMSSKRKDPGGEREGRNGAAGGRRRVRFQKKEEDEGGTHTYILIPPRVGVSRPIVRPFCVLFLSAQLVPLGSASNSDFKLYHVCSPERCRPQLRWSLQAVVVAHTHARCAYGLCGDSHDICTCVRASTSLCALSAAETPSTAAASSPAVELGSTRDPQDATVVQRSSKPPIPVRSTLLVLYTKCLNMYARVLMSGTAP